MAQLEWGEAGEAVKQFRDLIALEPLRSEGWTGLVMASQWYPGHTDSLDKISERVFQSEPHPLVLAELASAYRNQGRGVWAQALSDAGWERASGDRVLRRQREQFGLTTALYNGRPRYLFWHPITAEPLRPTEDGQTPIALTEIQRRAKALQERRGALKKWIDAFGFQDLSRVTSRLLFLATGDIPSNSDLVYSVQNLVEGLTRSDLESRPVWMDDGIHIWLETANGQQPGWLAGVVDIASALHAQKQPAALGRTIATGLGPKELLRREQIQFLMKQPRTELLKRLGFRESSSQGDLSDLALTPTP